MMLRKDIFRFGLSCHRSTRNAFMPRTAASKSVSVLVGEHAGAQLRLDAHRSPVLAVATRSWGSGFRLPFGRLDLLAIPRWGHGQVGRNGCAEKPGEVGAGVLALT